MAVAGESNAVSSPHHLQNSTELRPHYPFAAIVGMDAAKRALLLLAVDSRLKGALIASAPGRAKSVLAHALCALLPSQGNAKHSMDDSADEKQCAAPLVEIPLNVTEERLLGGLDLEQTLATGKRRLAMGLLAQANGGVLHVDDISLLDASILNHIAAALDAEIVRFEREGLSAIHAARFILVGTYNPAEGEVSAHLRERIGLIVESAGQESLDDLVEIMSRAIRFEEDPRGFVEEYALEMAALKAAIAAARSRLASVRITREDVRRISQAAISLGVEGNRPDVFAIRAARANAALAGRDSVADEDIIVAIQLALLPRATTMPMQQAPSEPDSELAQDEPNETTQEPDDSDSSVEKSPRGIEDLAVAALDALPPESALTAGNRKHRHASSGKRTGAINTTRGRYAGSSAKRNKEGKLALDATLRAAAPFQAIRRVRSMEINSPPNRSCENRIKIIPGDLRFKRLKSKSGILFIFALDASGSMALNRMAQAKGALARLLQQAYLHRDKVALISFRGSEAQTLLAPTRSVELAKQLVDALPTGGATPVAIAIVKALEIARLARLRGISQAMLVLLTDGRSNVGLRDDKTEDRALKASAINEELRSLGAELQSAGITSVVIDTKSRFVSSGEGRKLAESLGGRYLYLPRADSTAISNAIQALASQVRSGIDQCSKTRSK